MISPLIVPAVCSFLFAAVLSPVVIRLARRCDVLDKPTGEAKELHRKPMPLLGGLAIFIAIALVLVAFLYKGSPLLSGLVGVKQYLGFILGGFVLMIGGFLDDKFTLPAKITILFPIAAALIAVCFQIGVSKISNPFGGSPFELSDFASGWITFVWLLVVMYTTKLLDGLDGLATGVSAIGAFMMMCLALTVRYFQPDAAMFAAICTGALVGFLIWNFNPAKIFLGEGGSTFVGFTIGTLAVIGGGKLGTALLVLCLPFLDGAWVILRRTLVEHHSPTYGDRLHLHHRLLDLGLSQRQVVLLYYAIAASVCVATLFLQSREKLILFGVIVVLMIVFATALVLSERRRSTLV